MANNQIRVKLGNLAQKGRYDTGAGKWGASLVDAQWCDPVAEGRRPNACLERLAQCQTGLVRPAVTVENRDNQIVGDVAAPDCGQPASSEVEFVADAGELEVGYQPVCRIDAPHVTAFHAPSAVAVSQLAYPHFAPAALRMIDHVQMRRVMRYLHVHPDANLSVAIHDVSIGIDAQWEAIWATLACMPETAARLMIEIPEDARFALGVGRAFANRWRQLGSRIAIGRFGQRFGVEVMCDIPSPDWIMLDSSYWPNWTQDARAYQQLTGMVALANDLAPFVMVRGLTDEQARARLHAIGVQWVQMH
ncbi:EAL domain-containing protein [Burkholderia cepacia]|uniref:EAL domain-containing protein n=1 Tax=Burkholderia cepacia TaxID=292 RepID=UPI00158BA4E2|nr:EAL domain-containing protein [Burkholderia cepacia]